jgi:hypothetical protein
MPTLILLLLRTSVAASYRELTDASARIPRQTPSSFLKDACLQLHCLARDVLFFRAFAWRGPHRKRSFFYIVVTFLMGVFTGRRIETVVLLLLPVFVAMGMFTGIRHCYRNGPYVTTPT